MELCLFIIIIFLISLAQDLYEMLCSIGENYMVVLFALL